MHSTLRNFSTTVGSRKLDGLVLLSILTFFPKLKFETNNNDASEGTMKLRLPKFLKVKALIAYESALYVDAVDDDSIGITT